MRRVVREMHCREFTIVYGLTEASPGITQTTTDDPLERKVTTVGRPCHTRKSRSSIRTPAAFPR